MRGRWNSRRAYGTLLRWGSRQDGRFSVMTSITLSLKGLTLSSRTANQQGDKGSASGASCDTQAAPGRRPPGAAVDEAATRYSDGLSRGSNLAVAFFSDPPPGGVVGVGGRHATDAAAELVGPVSARAGGMSGGLCRRSGHRPARPRTGPGRRPSGDPRTRGAPATATAIPRQQTGTSRKLRTRGATGLGSGAGHRRCAATRTIYRGPATSQTQPLARQVMDADCPRV
jgi:hypothetical protein